MQSEILKLLIEKRRSIYPKDYTGAAIPDDVLEEILNSAQFAPNHKKQSLGDLKSFGARKKWFWG